MHIENPKVGIRPDQAVELYRVLGKVTEEINFRPIKNIVIYPGFTFQYAEDKETQQLLIPYPVVLKLSVEELRVGIKLNLAILGSNGPDVLENLSWFEKAVKDVLSAESPSTVSNFLLKGDYSQCIWSQILDLHYKNQSFAEFKPIEAFLLENTFKFEKVVDEFNDPSRFQGETKRLSNRFVLESLGFNWTKILAEASQSKFTCSKLFEPISSFHQDMNNLILEDLINQQTNHDGKSELAKMIDSLISASETNEFKEQQASQKPNRKNGFGDKM